MMKIHRVLRSNKGDAEDEGCCFNDAKRGIESQVVVSQDDDGELLSVENNDLTYAADIEENISEQGDVFDDDSEFEVFDEDELEIVKQRTSELYKDVKDYNGEGEEYLVGIINGSISKYNHTFYDAVQKVLNPGQLSNVRNSPALKNTAQQLEKEEKECDTEKADLLAEKVSSDSSSVTSKKRKFDDNCVSSSDEGDDLNSEYSVGSDECTSLRTSEPPGSPNLECGSLDHVSKKSKLMSEEELMSLKEKLKAANEEIAHLRNELSYANSELEKSEDKLKSVEEDLQNEIDDLVDDQELMSEAHVDHCANLEAEYKTKLQTKGDELSKVSSDVAHYKTMYGETKARLESCNSALLDTKSGLTQVTSELDTANKELSKTKALYHDRTKEVADLKKKLALRDRRAKGYSFKSVALGCLVGSIGTIGALLKLSSHVPDEN
ncbi:unnamed protein product [Ambrosiozyma monospora]|uniref:Unnamed protein product n=1 Tax=Ambrosiozyma monospora TaxID=43982 RepID=A0ACB5TCJ6_AMBMO|nr:unnamed protein product [Ambrosiozyma monospora]